MFHLWDALKAPAKKNVTIHFPLNSPPTEKKMKKENEKTAKRLRPLRWQWEAGVARNRVAEARSPVE